MDIDFQDIIALLAPGPGGVWDIFLYLIFFFAMITLFLIPDKNMVPTLLMAGVLLFAIIGKLSISAPALRVSPILSPCEFGTLVINVGMFVFPMLTAGTIRVSSKKKSRATAPAIISGILGGIYFFMFWFLLQQSC